MHSIFFLYYFLFMFYYFLFFIIIILFQLLNPYGPSSHLTQTHSRMSITYCLLILLFVELTHSLFIFILNFYNTLFSKRAYLCKQNETSNKIKNKPTAKKKHFIICTYMNCTFSGCPCTHQINQFNRPNQK